MVARVVIVTLLFVVCTGCASVAPRPERIDCVITGADEARIACPADAPADLLAVTERVLAGMAPPPVPEAVGSVPIAFVRKGEGWGIDPPAYEPPKSVSFSSPPTSGGPPRLVFAPPPVYPRDALERGIGGSCEVTFDLTKFGYPVNISVLGGSADDDDDHSIDQFCEAALSAVSRWRYDLSGVANVAITRDRIVRLDFTPPAEAEVDGRAPSLDDRDMRYVRSDPPHDWPGSVGACEVTFDVTPDGTPTRIRAKACIGPEEAARAAIRHVERVRFEPQIVRGVAVWRRNMRYYVEITND